MNVVVITDSLKTQLLSNGGEVELRDEAGILIGRFSRATGYVPELDMTPEEIERALSPDRKRYSTSEVLAYVKGLVS